MLPPIALFWGEDDPLIPVSHGVRAAATLEGIKLTRFPSVGHFPHRQMPSRFVEALLAFLDAGHAETPRILVAPGARRRSTGRPSALALLWAKRKTVP